MMPQNRRRFPPVPFPDRAPVLRAQDLAFEALAELLHLRNRTPDPDAVAPAERAAGYIRELSSAVEGLRLRCGPREQRS